MAALNSAYIARRYRDSLKGRFDRRGHLVQPDGGDAREAGAAPPGVGSIRPASVARDSTASSGGRRSRFMSATYASSARKAAPHSPKSPRDQRDVFAASEVAASPSQRLQRARRQRTPARNPTHTNKPTHSPVGGARQSGSPRRGPAHQHRDGRQASGSGATRRTARQPASGSRPSTVHGTPHGSGSTAPRGQKRTTASRSRASPSSSSPVQVRGTAPAAGTAGMSTSRSRPAAGPRVIRGSYGTPEQQGPSPRSSHGRGASSSHGRGASSSHGRGAPSSHGRGAPSSHGRGASSSHGRGAPSTRRAGAQARPRAVASRGPGQSHGRAANATGTYSRVGASAAAEGTSASSPNGPVDRQASVQPAGTAVPPPPPASSPPTAGQVYPQEEDRTHREQDQQQQQQHERQQAGGGRMAPSEGQKTPPKPKVDTDGLPVPPSNYPGSPWGDVVPASSGGSDAVVTSTGPPPVAATEALPSHPVATMGEGDLAAPPQAQSQLQQAEAGNDTLPDGPGTPRRPEGTTKGDPFDPELGTDPALTRGVAVDDADLDEEGWDPSDRRVLGRLDRLSDLLRGPIGGGAWQAKSGYEEEGKGGGRHSPGPGPESGSAGGRDDAGDLDKGIVELGEQRGRRRGGGAPAGGDKRTDGQSGSAVQERKEGEEGEHEPSAAGDGEAGRARHRLADGDQRQQQEQEQEQEQGQEAALTTGRSAARDMLESLYRRIHVELGIAGVGIAITGAGQEQEHGSGEQEDEQGQGEGQDAGRRGLKDAAYQSVLSQGTGPRLDAGSQSMDGARESGPGVSRSTATAMAGDSVHPAELVLMDLYHARRGAARASEHTRAVVQARLPEAAAAAEQARASSSSSSSGDRGGEDERGSGGGLEHRAGRADGSFSTPASSSPLSSPSSSSSTPGRGVDLELSLAGATAREQDSQARLVREMRQLFAVLREKRSQDADGQVMVMGQQEQDHKGRGRAVDPGTDRLLQGLDALHATVQDGGTSQEGGVGLGLSRGAQSLGMRPTEGGSDALASDARRLAQALYASARHLSTGQPDDQIDPNALRSAIERENQREGHMSHRYGSDASPSASNGPSSPSPRRPGVRRSSMPSSPDALLALSMAKASAGMTSDGFELPERRGAIGAAATRAVRGDENRHDSGGGGGEGGGGGGGGLPGMVRRSKTTSSVEEGDFVLWHLKNKQAGSLPPMPQVEGAGGAPHPAMLRRTKSGTSGSTGPGPSSPGQQGMGDAPGEMPQYHHAGNGIAKQKSFRSTDLLATLAAAAQRNSQGGGGDGGTGVGGGEARDATGLLRSIRGMSFEGELPASATQSGGVEGEGEDVDGSVGGEGVPPPRGRGHGRGGASVGNAIKPGSILDGLGLAQPGESTSALKRQGMGMGMGMGMGRARRSTVSTNTGWRVLLAASQGLEPRAKGRGPGEQGSKQGRGKNRAGKDGVSEPTAGSSPNGRRPPPTAAEHVQQQASMSAAELTESLLAKLRSGHGDASRLVQMLQTLRTASIDDVLKAADEGTKARLEAEGRRARGLASPGDRGNNGGGGPAGAQEEEEIGGPLFRALQEGDLGRGVTVHPGGNWGVGGDGGTGGHDGLGGSLSGAGERDARAATDALLSSPFAPAEGTMPLGLSLGGFGGMGDLLGASNGDFGVTGGAHRSSSSGGVGSGGGGYPDGVMQSGRAAFVELFPDSDEDEDEDEGERAKEKADENKEEEARKQGKGTDDDPASPGMRAAQRLEGRMRGRGYTMTLLRGKHSLPQKLLPSTFRELVQAGKQRGGHRAQSDEYSPAGAGYGQQINGSGASAPQGPEGGGAHRTGSGESYSSGSNGDSGGSADLQTTAAMLEQILDSTRQQLHYAGEAERRRALEAELAVRAMRRAEEEAAAAEARQAELGVPMVAGPDPRQGDESILRVKGVEDGRVMLHATGVMEHSDSVGVRMRGNAAMQRRVSDVHGLVGAGPGQGPARPSTVEQAELAARRQEVLRSGLRKLRGAMFRLTMVWRFKRSEGPASSRINRALLRAMLWEKAHGVAGEQLQAGVDGVGGDVAGLASSAGPNAPSSPARAQLEAKGELARRLAQEQAEHQRQQAAEKVRQLEATRSRNALLAKRLVQLQGIIQDLLKYRRRGTRSGVSMDGIRRKLAQLLQPVPQDPAMIERGGMAPGRAAGLTEGAGAAVGAARAPQPSEYSVVERTLIAQEQAVIAHQSEMDDAREQGEGEGDGRAGGADSAQFSLRAGMDAAAHSQKRTGAGDTLYSSSSSSPTPMSPLDRPAGLGQRSPQSSSSAEGTRRGLGPAVSTDLDPETRRRRDAYRLQQLARAAIVDPSGFVFSPVVDWEWMGDSKAADTSKQVIAGEQLPHGGREPPARDGIAKQGDGSHAAGLTAVPGMRFKSYDGRGAPPGENGGGSGGYALGAAAAAGVSMGKGAGGVEDDEELPPALRAEIERRRRDLGDFPEEQPREQAKQVSQGGQSIGTTVGEGKPGTPPPAGAADDRAASESVASIRKPGTPPPAGAFQAASRAIEAQSYAPAPAPLAATSSTAIPSARPAAPSPPAASLTGMTPHYRYSDGSGQKEVEERARRRSVVALSRIREQVRQRPMPVAHGDSSGTGASSESEPQRTFGGDKIPRKRRVTVAELEDQQSYIAEEYALHRKQQQNPEDPESRQRLVRLRQEQAIREQRQQRRASMAVSKFRYEKRGQLGGRKPRSGGPPPPPPRRTMRPAAPRRASAGPTMLNDDARRAPSPPGTPSASLEELAAAARSGGSKGFRKTRQPSFVVLPPVTGSDSAVGGAPSPRRPQSLQVLQPEQGQGQGAGSDAGSSSSPVASGSPPLRKKQSRYSMVAMNDGRLFGGASNVGTSADEFRSMGEGVSRPFPVQEKEKQEEESPLQGNAPPTETQTQAQARPQEPREPPHVPAPAHMDPQPMEHSKEQTDSEPQRPVPRPPAAREIFKDQSASAGQPAAAKAARSAGEGGGGTGTGNSELPAKPVAPTNAPAPAPAPSPSSQPPVPAMASDGLSGMSAMRVIRRSNSRSHIQLDLAPPGGRAGSPHLTPGASRGSPQGLDPTMGAAPGTPGNSPPGPSPPGVLKRTPSGRGTKATQRRPTGMWTDLFGSGPKGSGSPGAMEAAGAAAASRAAQAALQPPPPASPPARQPPRPPTAVAERGTGAGPKIGSLSAEPPGPPKQPAAAASSAGAGASHGGSGASLYAGARQGQAEQSGFGSPPPNDPEPYIQPVTPTAPPPSSNGSGSGGHQQGSLGQGQGSGGAYAPPAPAPLEPSGSMRDLLGSPGEDLLDAIVEEEEDEGDEYDE